MNFLSEFLSTFGLTAIVLALQYLIHFDIKQRRLKIPPERKYLLLDVKFLKLLTLLWVGFLVVWIIKILATGRGFIW
jgi:glycerol uptake facilitator-like aquaporin